MTLPDLPENAALSASANAIPQTRFATADDAELNGESRNRRQRRRRTKQWSDGVIGMANGPLQQELAELSFRPPRPLRTDSVVEFGIPTPGDVTAHVEKEHGEDSWRFRVIQFLHQRWVEYFFMALLFLDVVILFVEVSLQAAYPLCDVIIRDGISCSPAPVQHDNHTRFLANKKDHHDEICSASTSPTAGIEWTPKPEWPVGCDPHKWHGVHVTEEVLFIITMIILSLFFLELNVMMVVLKPQVFFRQVFFLADYLIIGASLAMELTFHLLHKELTSTLTGMLVIFRSWRYVRIGHGIVELTAKWADRDIHRLLNYTEHLESILQEKGIAVPEEERKRILHKVDSEPDLMAQVRRHHAEEKRAKRDMQHQESGGSGQDAPTSDDTDASPKAA